MKYLVISFFALLAFSSCQNASSEQKPLAAEKTKADFFGEKITEDQAKPTDSLKTMMGSQQELPCKLSGKIGAVCQKKGCWMDLKNADGSTLHVTFKDYGFFMPKDAAGRTAIIDGVARMEETSVDELKEIASDAGKSKAEIDAINTPQKEITFEAKGVILK